MLIHKGCVRCSCVCQESWEHAKALAACVFSMLQDWSDLSITFPPCFPLYFGQMSVEDYMLMAIIKVHWMTRWFWTKMHLLIWGRIASEGQKSWEIKKYQQCCKLLSLVAIAKSEEMCSQAPTDWRMRSPNRYIKFSAVNFVNAEASPKRKKETTFTKQHLCFRFFPSSSLVVSIIIAFNRNLGFGCTWHWKNKTSESCDDFRRACRS